MILVSSGSGSRLVPKRMILVSSGSGSRLVPKRMIFLQRKRLVG
jgi:hypothetical protein